ncbi:MAG: anti-sigma factor antagonist [Clostridia bacterium]|nr:anti-sigma factor antagonist [Clostridia bacterium]
MKIELSGRIDSGNARQIESEIFSRIADANETEVILDAEKLDYISSAGLRVILHVKKAAGDIRIINVNSDIYEILEMTGFTEIMTVEKAYRTVSVEGCEEIGRGANGTIYRIDSDNVVKVYNNPEALADIQHEREVAKLALILGIPTAISYDVVRVGNSYGSVFELLNARSFSQIIASEPDKLDWCVEEFAEMLKKIHGTVVPEGKLPDVRETALSWARFVSGYIPEKDGRRLVELISEIPADNHMIHGDYHPKNLELQGDEVLIIDMDTLSVGNPVLELASIFNALIGYSEYDHEQIKRFQGFDFETGRSFWRKFLAKYLGTTNARTIDDAEDKASVIGYTRMIRRSIRRNGLDSENGRNEIEFWKERLLAALNRVDNLIIRNVPDAGINEIEVEAAIDNLPSVTGFIDSRLEAVDCPPKAAMQINLAAEEIFVNISQYAYAPGKGKATVRVEVSVDPVTVTLTFIDSGTPYDPLARRDPDVSLPAENREIGGLGIFLTKKAMDDVRYEYRDGKNILTLKKCL